MTERMSERLFPIMAEQITFLGLLDDLKENLRPTTNVTIEEVQVNPIPESPRDRSVFGNLPVFPYPIQQALMNGDPIFQRPTKNKMRTMLIQVLFDHLFQITMYPSHKQYVELLSMLVTNYPVLREKVGSGYDGLHQSLKNKFKKERRPLVGVEEVNNVRERFRVATSGRKRQVDGAAVELTRISRPSTVADEEVSQLGEDERSVEQHVEIQKREAQKCRPNLDVLKTCLLKTKMYRRQFMVANSTAAIIEEFPSLRIPTVLLAEMVDQFAIDTDKLILSNLAALADKILASAPQSKEKEEYTTAVDDCLDASARKGMTLNAAILLLPSLLREDASFLFAVDKSPRVPTPTISLRGASLKPEKLNIMMDNSCMLVEDTSVDLSLALAALFSTFYVYGIQYPSQLKKTFSFLEHFVFNVKTSPLNVTAKRVYNSL